LGLDKTDFAEGFGGTIGQGLKELQDFQMKRLTKNCVDGEVEPFYFGRR
jgi:hypothetical protein